MELIASLESRCATAALALPDSPEYAKACALYSTSHATAPQAVVRCRTERDVVAAVRTASEYEVALSARGGGHNATGHALCDGIVLDFSELRNVRVDPERRLARAEPGATWADYDRQTQAHGLAGPGGAISGTGVAGLTLGGGIGALRGLHGFACDNLRSVDVVLADGTLRTADAWQEKDLFWAVHGGGGNFGVVVGFEFHVHPLTRMVSGILGFPLESAASVLARYDELADELPDAFTAEFMFVRDPAPGSDRFLLLLLPHHAGRMEDAEPTLKLLRGLGSPVVDAVQELPYQESQRLTDHLISWGHRHQMASATLAGLDEGAVHVLERAIREAPSALSHITLEHLHGEIARIDPESTPLGIRQARFNVMIAAEWEHAADDGANTRWTEELRSALAPFSAGGRYVNYMPRESTPDDLRDAYGHANFRRLREIKSAYDPENFFRSNLNIPPLGHDDRAAGGPVGTPSK